MKVHSYLIILILLMSISLTYAIEELPPVVKGECINLVQLEDISTYQNLTYVQQPNSYKDEIGQYMTKVGNQYYYMYCNTTQYGTYLVNGCSELGCWAYKFKVNGSGQEMTQSQMTLIIAGVVVMILVAIFFFTLAIIFKAPGVKIFLMSLSTLTVIVLIGLIASNYSIYLAEYTGLTSVYNSYYVIMIILSGVAVLGIIVWFIYWSISLFSKTRGLTPDDD